MSQPPENTDYVSTYEETDLGSGLVKFVQQKPAVATGVLGMFGALGYGYWRYKTKGFLITPSLFILQLRVGAQAAVVGCLTVGMIYKMVNDHVLKKKPEE